MHGASGARGGAGLARRPRGPAPGAAERGRGRGSGAQPRRPGRGAGAPGTRGGRRAGAPARAEAAGAPQAWKSARVSWRRRLRQALFEAAPAPRRIWPPGAHGALGLKPCRCLTRRLSRWLPMTSTARGPWCWGNHCGTTGPPGGWWCWSPLRCPACSGKFR